MEMTREQVTGALALLDDVHVRKVWDIMKIVMPTEILEEIAYDLAAGARIENDPDCHEFVSEAELMAELGINEEDLKG